MEIRNGEVNLHVQEDGDPESPPVLLLHGITSSAATYDWLVPHLAPHHRVLRLDFRGHGRSDRTPGRYLFADYVSDAVAACEQVAGRPCVAIGHSLGGATAAALAQQRPELLDAVVLEDPALMGAEDLASLEGNALMPMFALMREVIPVFQSSGLTVDQLTERLALAPTAAGGVLGEVVHEDAVRSIAEAQLQLDASVLDPVLTATQQPVFDPSAPIPVPGLVLAADPVSPDAVVRERDAARLAEHSPLVEVRVLPGATHLIHDEKAQRPAYLEAVTAFLAARRGS